MKRRSFLKCSLPLALGGTSVAAPSHRPELTFGVIADPQYADKAPKGTRFYRNSLRKLQAAITELNRHSLDFVITLGDIIDSDFESFAGIMPLYEALRAPWRIVPGNHDFEVAGADKAKVLAALCMKHPYQSESHGNWRTISLDGTDVSTWRQAADSPKTAEAATLLKKLQAAGKPQAHSWNAAIGPDQLTWLERELEAAKMTDQRVILFNHFPVLPAGNSHNLWNAGEVVDLLSRYDHIAAYMNGHNHAGNFASRGGCHYVNFKGMVETADRSAFAIVRCYPDRLEVDGFDTEIDRELKPSQ